MEISPQEPVDYSQSNYTRDQRRGIQGFGNALIDKSIEKLSRDKTGKRVLEIGGSSGEHIRYISRKEMFKWSTYEILDLEPGLTNPSLSKELGREGILFTKGDVENLTFENDSFDIVLSTCVFSHLSSPEKALEELRRITNNSGQIVIGIPCDPGLLNRFVKLIITYPRMKRNGTLNPRLKYARDHKNSVGNLITLVNHVFSEDNLKLRYSPFALRSWNLNLFVTAVIEVKKSGGI
jgi:ubiquinone/menaquinone biosynthesis C-methylase UbiE